MGINNKWSWPFDDGVNYLYDYDYYWPVKNEINKESFDLFYEYHGFEKMNLLDFSYDPKYIKVALYCNKGTPTHAAMQIDDFWWESKIGRLGIIRHDLFEIEDNVYGEVYQIYRKLKTINLKYNQFI